MWLPKVKMAPGDVHKRKLDERNEMEMPAKKQRNLEAVQPASRLLGGERHHHQPAAFPRFKEIKQFRKTAEEAELHPDLEQEVMQMAERLRKGPQAVKLDLILKEARKMLVGHEGESDPSHTREREAKLKELQVEREDMQLKFSEREIERPKMAALREDYVEEWDERAKLEEQLKEKEVLIRENEAVIQEMNARNQKQDAKLQEQDATIKKKEALLLDQVVTITRLQRRIRKRDHQLQGQERELKEQFSAMTGLREKSKESEIRLQELEEAMQERRDSDFEEHNQEAANVDFTPRYQFAIKMGIDVSGATYATDPAPSESVVGEMFYCHEGDARIRFDAWDVFQTIKVVVQHARSETTDSLPARYRAAIWNIWMALEKDTTPVLRQKVGHGLLTMAEEVIRGYLKRPQDSMTFWITSQLALHLSRFGIGRNLPIAKDEVYKGLTAWAVRNFMAASGATVPPLLDLVDDLLKEGDESLHKKKASHPDLGCTLVLWDHGSEIATMSNVQDGKWWIWIVQKINLYNYHINWSPFLHFEFGERWLPRLIKLDSDEWIYGGQHRWVCTHFAELALHDEKIEEMRRRRAFF